MNKKNLSLYIGLAIPVVLLITVMSVSYLPHLFIKPDVEFVYSMGNDYYSTSNPYIVKDGKVTEAKVTSPAFPDTYYANAVIAPKLYIYNSRTNQSQETTIEDLAEMKILDSVESKEGYTVEPSYSSNLVFGGSNYGGLYLKKGLFSRKITLQGAGNNYNPISGYDFIGWIE